MTSADIKRGIRNIALVTAAGASLAGIGAQLVHADGPTTSEDNSPFTLLASSEGPISAFPANNAPKYRITMSLDQLGIQVEYGKDCAPKPNPDRTVNCTYQAEHYRVNAYELVKSGSVELPSPLWP